jgi:hypothetical protein
MPLFERFTNEADFRDKFVKPLLNKLGFYGVSEQHGSQEFGKDFIFSELHRLGGMRHYAAQVKHEKSVNQGRIVDDLLAQIRQAFSVPFTRADSPRQCYVSTVYVFNSGGITENAKEQLLNNLEREHYGDNVLFFDGDRLDALNQWATLQTDTITRARLLGLRSTLISISLSLNQHLTGTSDLRPHYTPGIELYLSEPVGLEIEQVGLLFKLWAMLQGLEAFRTMALARAAPAAATTLLAEMAPYFKETTQEAHALTIELWKTVDAAMKKMNPIE